MKETLPLSSADLALAGLLVLALAAVARVRGLGVSGSLLIAAARMALQLTLVGLVLATLFRTTNPLWVALMALAMLAIAGREVAARQKRRLVGWWGFGIGTGSMFVSAFAVTVFGLAVAVRADPWYTPQYAIPILGMLLGNTMNGIALCLDRITEGAWQQREIIEQRLMLGEDRQTALGDLRREAVRAAMIPVINAMSVAGVVSLPGMMTGQILGGNPPGEAVKYQILIWFLIAAGSGCGMLIAVALAGRRLFDERHRLRLDRLGEP
jgi:putative ABC transport system permease protein